MDKQYLEILPRIYESSLEPQLWTDNLDALISLAGAKGSVLVLWKPLEINPLKDENREVYEFLQGAIITIIDPKEETSYNVQGLEQLYDLTAAEINLYQIKNH